MRGILVAAVCCLVAVVFSACQEVAEPEIDGHDASTDADTDTDTDTGSDTDTDSDMDTDTDTDADTDTDTDTDTENCTVDMLGTMTIYGSCQDTAEWCPVIVGEDQSGCPETTVCCVPPDECETGEISAVASCSLGPCTAGIGFHAGCPGDGWCCLDTGYNFGGDVAEGEACAVVLVPDLVELAGVCQPDDSECAGGYVEDAESGNCQSGLDCCIGDDQCLATLTEGVCQAEQCRSWFDIHAGCPGDQHCCWIH